MEKYQKKPFHHDDNLLRRPPGSHQRYCIQRNYRFLGILRHIPALSFTSHLHDAQALFFA